MSVGVFLVSRLLSDVNARYPRLSGGWRCSAGSQTVSSSNWGGRWRCGSRGGMTGGDVISSNFEFRLYVAYAMTLGRSSHRVVHAGDSLSRRIRHPGSNPVASGLKLPPPHFSLIRSIACISAVDRSSRSGSISRLPWRRSWGSRPHSITPAFL